MAVFHENIRFDRVCVSGDRAIVAKHVCAGYDCATGGCRTACFGCGFREPLGTMPWCHVQASIAPAASGAI